MPKAPKLSAGLLMFRKSRDLVEVFLVHPGGPFWSKKNEGSWTIPKGEYDPDEEPLAAAQREFLEETSFNSAAPFIDLGSVRQKSGKVVLAWAFEGNCDPAPPRSKKRITIPEVDRGAWFPLSQAATFIREEQRPFLQRLNLELTLDKN
jgi:predicted NUDIX family NTP pyrophosphohydrolase